MSELGDEPGLVTTKETKGLLVVECHREFLVRIEVNGAKETLPPLNVAGAVRQSGELGLGRRYCDFRLSSSSLVNGSIKEGHERAFGGPANL